MAKAAQLARVLKAAFELHETETEERSPRGSEKVFEEFHETLSGKTCDAAIISGIIEEGQEVMKEFEHVLRALDAGLLAAAQGG